MSGIGDDRVIQFGSGVSLWDKARTAINAVTLADFEQGGTAQLVRHGYAERLGGTGHDHLGGQASESRRRLPGAARPRQRNCVRPALRCTHCGAARALDCDRFGRQNFGPAARM